MKKNILLALVGLISAGAFLVFVDPLFKKDEKVTRVYETLGKWGCFLADDAPDNSDYVTLEGKQIKISDLPTSWKVDYARIFDKDVVDKQTFFDDLSVSLFVEHKSFNQLFDPSNEFIEDSLRRQFEVSEEEVNRHYNENEAAFSALAKVRALSLITKHLLNRKKEENRQLVIDKMRGQYGFSSSFTSRCSPKIEIGRELLLREVRLGDKKSLVMKGSNFCPECRIKAHRLITDLASFQDVELNFLLTTKKSSPSTMASYRRMKCYVRVQDSALNSVKDVFKVPLQYKSSIQKTEDFLLSRLQTEETKQSFQTCVKEEGVRNASILAAEMAPRLSLEKDDPIFFLGDRLLSSSLLEEFTSSNKL